VHVLSWHAVLNCGELNLLAAYVECSCSSSHAMPPFNQRLMSSTPAGTPKRKRLVERQGVLLLDGSTDTQILNSTDTAAAVRPPQSPMACPHGGPCLSRGDVQFAPALHVCSSLSSSSVASSMGSNVELAQPAVSVVRPPVHSSLASGHIVSPYRGSSAPTCYTTVPSSPAWQPHTQPAIFTSAGSSFHPVTTSLPPGIDRIQQPGIPEFPPVSYIHPAFGGLYAANPTTSVRFTDPPQTAMNRFHLPVRPPTQSEPCSTAPPSCSCAFQTAVPTSAAAVASSDLSRPPMTLAAASSSQETIEIQLEHSPGRSSSRPPREQFTVVRGTTPAAVRNRRRHPRTSGATMRDRRPPDGVGRRPRCRNTADDDGADTERMASVLRQLKSVVMANRNPELSRLLSEVCQAAAGPSPSVLPPQQPAVSDSTPVVDQLRSEITQLNRLENCCTNCGLWSLC